MRAGPSKPLPAWPVPPYVLPPGTVVGAVLAGGYSSRMGHDKAVLEASDGRTLLTRTLDTLAAAGVTHTVLSVSDTRRAETLRQALPASEDVPVVFDSLAGRGPLGGLAAVLARFPGHPVLLVACDMPHLDPCALRAVLDAAQAVGDDGQRPDIVLPRVDGRDQPLHSLYGPRCLPVAGGLLTDGRYAMRGLLQTPDLSLRVLDTHAFAVAGATSTCFTNVNTLEEARAEGLVVPPRHRDGPHG